MKRDAYDRLTERLREGLSADARVLGLVALGSMSGEPPVADEWSDHDFFVITRAGEQERMRTDLAWLPDAGQIALSYRETAHGVKVLYRNAHLLEFAVFDLEELSLARVNRYRTLFDRSGIEERMRALRERTSREVAERRPEDRWLSGQFLAALLVGAGRYRRGERVGGRAQLQAATVHLAQLLARASPPESPGVLDSLDPLRRFEQACPELGRELDDALGHPPPKAALRLLRIARRELPRRLPEFPDEAAGVLEGLLAGNAR
jgi:lincosamide nucleotidyltransferase